MLIEGKRGPGSFPPPVYQVGDRFRFWRWPEVERGSKRSSPRGSGANWLAFAKEEQSTAVVD